MAQRDDKPLFDPAELISDAQLEAESAEALHPDGGRRHPDLDAARLWRSADDGMLVRGVKPHSADKSKLVSRSLDTVTTAMADKWFATKHGLEYLELYSGPGRLLDERTGEELPGSPIQALEVRRPFTRYVFNDYSPECAQALQARVGVRSDATVVEGDANSAVHLERVAGLLSPKALLIVYLDPARPKDLHWSTVELLSLRFEFADLIINLPVNSLLRSILGAFSGGVVGGTAGRFLNHPNPADLLVRTPTDKLIVSASITAIREHYDDQLVSLGFRKPARRTVEFPAGNPYYDILYASRHEMGVKLWDRTNPKPEPPGTLF